MARLSTSRLEASSFTSLPAGSPRIGRFIVLPCILVKFFGLFVIDGEGVSVRAVVPRWFGGFFEGGVGTIVQGCRRSHANGQGGSMRQ